MADRLTGIEVVLRAIRLGGLSAAARALGMSPTMAARHLNDLEARLGTTLVNRTTRRLALTPAGADYLDKAERFLADLSEAEAEAAAQATRVEGLLRVSAPSTFGTMYVATLTAEFRRLHPGVVVELGLSDRFVDLLEERWDTAIRIGHLQDSSLIARKLARVRLSVCAAPAYLAERGTPRVVGDLSGHDCLGHSIVTATGTTTWSFGRNGEIRVPVSGPIHADDGEALLRASVAGQGLVYVPTFISAPYIAAGSLAEVTLDVEPLDLGAVHAISHPARRPSARTRAWVEFLTDRLPLIATSW